MNIYLKVLRQYADFKGRARRREYWTFILISLLVATALGIVDGIISYLAEIPLPILTTLYLLATFVPALAVLVRRLHDSGKSGWWFFVSIIPGIGSIVLLVFLFMDSEAKTNKWGHSPKLKA